jgi:Fic/DOC family
MYTDRMKFAKTYSIHDVAEYVSRPVAARPAASYDPSLLVPDPIFTPAESSALQNAITLGTGFAHEPSRIQRLLIDLTWASSQLEGNTYTRLDTQTLIEYGKKNDKKTAEETLMILNHKQAVAHIIEHQDITSANIKAIHRHLMLAENPAPFGHFLDDHKSGRVRSYTQDGLYIGGTSYYPPQEEGRGAGFIEREFDRLVESARAQPTAVDQSFFLLTRLPYLQAFEDGNKRTGRLSANMPLLANGLCPVPFLNFSKESYTKGLLCLYELNDERLMKAGFVKAAITSVCEYTTDPALRMTIAKDRSGYIDSCCRDILGGDYIDPDQLLGEAKSSLPKQNKPANEP